MKITSSANPTIKAVLNIKRRKSSDDRALFLIEGPHLLEMALHADVLIREVFFTESFNRKEEGQLLLEQLKKNRDSLYEVTDSILHKLTETEAPQGIVAVAEYRQPSLKELRLGSNPLLVVADGIQDPGNLGAMIRTADAAGADAVIILPGTCDVTLQKTIRATAGSLFHIPVAEAPVKDFLDWLRSHTMRLAVTAADAGTSLFEARLDGPLALAFGNEAHGVRQEIRKAADLVVHIPIYGNAESLNVAASAAILLYETIRQRSG